MPTTFQTAYTALMRQCNRPLSETQVLDQAKQEINNAIRLLQRRHAFRFTERLHRFTYAANAETVVFPTVSNNLARDFKNVQLIVPNSNDGAVLKYKTYDQITQEKLKHQATRQEQEFDREPTYTETRSYANYVGSTHRLYFFVLGDRIGLYPTPRADVELLVNYHVWFPDLVADSDTNFFLDYGYDLILDIATSKMATFLRDSQLKAMSREDQEASISTFITWDSQLHESTYTNIH